MQASSSAKASVAARPSAGLNGATRRAVLSTPQRRRCDRLTVSAFGGVDASSVDISAVSTVVSTLVAAGAAWALAQQAPETEQSACEERDSCPRCGGTGYEPCTCTRWSNDGLGCDACNKTALMRCRGCGGGGKARLAQVDLKIELPDRRLGQ